jgi:hypothetical protein
MRHSTGATSKWLFVPGLPSGSLETVSKLSQFGLPGFWQLIAHCLDLQSGWGLKQTCSSPRELSNGVLHSAYTHRGRVDSWLLAVGNQTASLTPGPSFDHNSCCRCPNDSCEAILDIYTSRPFHGEKNISRRGVLTLAIELWVSGVLEDSGVPFLAMWVATSHFPQSGVTTILAIVS